MSPIALIIAVLIIDNNRIQLLSNRMDTMERILMICTNNSTNFLVVYRYKTVE